MAGTWARTRVAERVTALAAAGLGDRELRREVLAVLGEVIGFDAYVWLLTDPVTAVGPRRWPRCRASQSCRP